MILLCKNEVFKNNKHSEEKETTGYVLVCSFAVLDNAKLHWSSSPKLMRTEKP